MGGCVRGWVGACAYVCVVCMYVHVFMCAHQCV